MRTPDSPARALAFPLELRAAPDARGFALHRESDPALGWDAIGGAIEVNGRLVSLADADARAVRTGPQAATERTRAIEVVLPESGLAWRWDLALHAASLEVTARLRNTGHAPLTIGAWHVLHLTRANGGATHIQTAVSSTPAYVGLINAARVGRDFGEGRPLAGMPLSDWRNATYVILRLPPALPRGNVRALSYALGVRAGGRGPSWRRVRRSRSVVH